MIRKIESSTMGSSHLGWLNSLFHFSFAEYRNPKNINFGALRVINDDLIAPHTGFDPHPHRDMEIISYVIDGHLTHADSMGNKSTLNRGEIQYMSAGTGVQHSEHNRSDEPLRLLQIWIFPDRNNHVPAYGEYRFPWEARVNQWFHIVSQVGGKAPININQDANLYVIELRAGQKTEFTVEKGRQVYLVQIEGTSEINGLTVNERDALASIETDLNITAFGTSHLLVIELSIE